MHAALFSSRSGIAFALAWPLLGFAAQSDARLDRVLVLDERDRAAVAVIGRVERNELERVVIDVAGRKREFEPARVQSIAWGEAPREFHEAQRCVEHAAWPDAVARFRVAAAAPKAREVVIAAARFGAVEALLRAGASEPARFGEAALAAREFLAQHPTSADVPRARMLEARALRLAGKSNEAAALYGALWSELADGKAPAGYEPLLCARAGLEAARAQLDARDGDAARATFAALDARLQPLIASSADDPRTRQALEDMRDEVSLSAGFVDLAAGRAEAALAFFESTRTLVAGRASPALRACLDLGTGRALFALGRVREASLALARVCALEASDRDRVALATCWLAECYAHLPDADAKAQACRRARAVIDQDGDTPAANRARALAKELGC